MPHSGGSSDFVRRYCANGPRIAAPAGQALAQSEPPLPKGGPEAIRFENAAGLFYDRGIILSRDEHRITYRSLDGSITSAHMDRLLTTEAYYEWLLSKPRQ